VVFGDGFFLGSARELGMAIPTESPARTSTVADSMAVAWRAGATRLGALAAHDPMGSSGFSEEDAWILRLAAFAAGLVWQIKTAERHIRALGDSEAGRLREHIERMQAMEKMKGDFLKLASHELRGPIGIVRGYYSMMADGSLDDDGVARAMPVIGRKLDDMNALVTEMLEAARLDEGLTRLDRGPHDLRSLVGLATAAIRPQVTAAHHLVTQVPGEPVMVGVDAGRVVTILRNLLDNALKFSPSGGEIRCTVSVGGDRARVHIVDHGLGIPPEQMYRLFTRFSRLVTPDNSHISGTGLGLYLSRELARLHGGDITVSSRPGAGTRFVLSLPLLRAPA
jgi:signal transduction histidine kinase